MHPDTHTEIKKLNRRKITLKMIFWGVIALTGVWIFGVLLVLWNTRQSYYDAQHPGGAYYEFCNERGMEFWNITFGANERHLVEISCVDEEDHLNTFACRQYLSGDLRCLAPDGPR